MGKKLKPCTTCGWNQPVISISEYNDGNGKKSIKDLFTVVCNKCGSKSGQWTRKGHAIEAWNHKHEIMESKIEVLKNKITKNARKTNRKMTCAKCPMARLDDGGDPIACGVDKCEVQKALGKGYSVVRSE